MSFALASMLFYLKIMAIITLIFWIFRSIKKNTLNSSTALFLTFLVFFVFHAFRDLSIGADTWVYYLSRFRSYHFQLGTPNNFEHIINNYMNIQGEFLFRMYLVVLRDVFGEDAFWMNFGLAAIIIPPYYYFIKKYSKNYYLSSVVFILGFYFAQSMNVTRQYAAVGFCLMAFDAAAKRDYLKFFLFVILSTFFHSASLVFLIVILPVFFKSPAMSLYMRLALILTSVVIGYIVLPTILEIVDPSLLVYDEHYGGSLTAIANLGLVLITSFALVMMAKKNEKMRYHYIYVFIVSMAFATNLLAFRINIFARLSFWFLIFQIIIIPNYFMTKIRTREEFYLRIMILGYLFFYLYFAASRDSAFILTQHYRNTGSPGFIWRFPWRV